MKNIVDKLIEIFMGMLLLVMVTTACWQVFTRFILNNPSGIAEELLRYMLIWLTMIGAAYAYGKQKHLAIVFFIEQCSQTTQRKIMMIVDAIVIIFSSAVLLYGGFFTVKIAVGQKSSAMGMPMEYLYISLLISGILFLYYATIHLKQLLKNPEQLMRGTQDDSSH